MQQNLSNDKPESPSEKEQNSPKREMGSRFCPSKTSLRKVRKGPGCISWRTIDSPESNFDIFNVGVNEERDRIERGPEYCELDVSRFSPGIYMTKIQMRKAGECNGSLDI